MLCSLLLFLNHAVLALAFKTIAEMKAAATASTFTLESVADRNQRFKAAATEGGDEHGAYDEFPVVKLAEVLHHKTVRAVLESGKGGSEGARFVDITSGAGRVCLALAGMHTWLSVTGIEDLELLHFIAEKGVDACEQIQVVPKGVVRPLHSDGRHLYEPPMADALAKADIVFMHSTTIPAVDGLRLPVFSAALSSTMQEGSLAITTDKWLVGDRFHFVDLMTINGDAGEIIQLHIWRLDGQPAAEGFDHTLAEIQSKWMAGDAEELCEYEQQGYDRACQALMDAIENMPEDFKDRLKEVEEEMLGEEENEEEL